MLPLTNNEHALYEMHCILYYFMVTYLQYLYATDCLHVRGFTRGIISLLVKQKTSETSIMFKQRYFFIQ